MHLVVSTGISCSLIMVDRYMSLERPWLFIGLKTLKSMDSVRRVFRAHSSSGRRNENSFCPLFLFCHCVTELGGGRGLEPFGHNCRVYPRSRSPGQRACEHASDGLIRPLAPVYFYALPGHVPVPVTVLFLSSVVAVVSDRVSCAVAAAGRRLIGRRFSTSSANRAVT